MKILVDREVLLLILHNIQDADAACLGKLSEPMPHLRRAATGLYALLSPNHNEETPVQPGVC